MKKTLLLFVVGLYCFDNNLVAQTVKPNRTSNKTKAVQDRMISIDFNNTAGALNTFFKECVGAGRANEGLRADWQQQLAYVRKECGFRYIRMHGLLTDDMAVYKEDGKGNPVYNFMYVDVLFDY